MSGRSASDTAPAAVTVVAAQRRPRRLYLRAPLLLIALVLYACIEVWVPNVRDPIFSAGTYALTWVELIYLVTVFLAMFELLRVSQPGVDNTVEALLMLGVSGIMLVLFVLGVAGLPECRIFDRMEFLMLLLISVAQVILAFLINARTLKRTIDYASPSI